jgi:hypothetical protein
MPGYGIDTGADIFGVIAALQADTLGTGIFKVQNWAKTPHALNSAYALDSLGDAAAATYYGGTGGLGLGDTSGADTAFDVSYDIVMVSGNMDISDIVLGAKGTGYVMNAAELSTKNNEWPKISASGRTAVAAIDTAAMGTWAPPAATVNGRKKAQPIGFVTGAGCKLQSSSVSLKTDDASEMDSQGAEATYDIANGILNGSADFVEVTAAATWTMDTTFAATEIQGPGQDKSNTNYGTTSATLEKVLTRV